MAWIIVLRHRIMSFLDDVSSSSDSTYFLEGARTWLTAVKRFPKKNIRLSTNRKKMKNWRHYRLLQPAH
ncbi:unnamed protein product [Prunus armeniaca]|uniref:Uncharacterized protein n=1 Tax=Prunus armeniaca TaxID=36596 RepID=A0A6J5WGL7_PRUAR|nr:unnamed protein product [Prunus armeniaca]